MQRNITLDYFKILLSILVVFIHMPFLFEKDSVVSWYLSKGFGDTATCFFVINGYFLASKIDDSKKFRKYIFHLFIVYLLWSIIYLPNYYDAVTRKYIVLMFLSGYYQLWYLTALLVGATMLFSLRKLIKNDTIVLIIAVVLYLIIRTIGRGLSPIILGYLFNFFTGFLLVSIGYYVRTKIGLDRIKNKYLLPLTVLIFAIYIISVHPHIDYPLKDFTVAIFFAMSCSILVFSVLKNSSYRPNNRWTQLLGDISAGVFYVHVIATTRLVSIDTENNIQYLPAVLSISFFMALVVIWINKRAKYLM